MESGAIVVRIAGHADKVVAAPQRARDVLVSVGAGVSAGFSLRPLGRQTDELGLLGDLLVPAGVYELVSPQQNVAPAPQVHLRRWRSPIDDLVDSLRSSGPSPDWDALGAVGILVEEIRSGFTEPQLPDPRKVAQQQQEALGDFFRRPLPVGARAMAACLPLAGAVTSQSSQTAARPGRRGRTLSKIVADDAAQGINTVVALAGRSGAGKTATIVDLSRRHYVVYLCAVTAGHIRNLEDIPDPLYTALDSDVFQMSLDYHKQFGAALSWEAMKARHRAVFGSACRRVTADLVGRLAFLLFLLEREAKRGRALDPSYYFLVQTLENPSVQRIIQTVWRRLDASKVSGLFSVIKRHVDTHVNRLEGARSVVLVGDEMQMTKELLGGYLMSTEALASSESVLGAQGQLPVKHRRYFLSAVSSAFAESRYTVVLLGDTRTLVLADHVCLAVGKQAAFETLTQFPLCTDPRGMLDRLVNMDGCVLSDEQAAVLKGRMRLSILVVGFLLQQGPLDPSDSRSKQDRLDDAIRAAVQLLQRGIWRSP
eukprot:m51a1_g5835 hypothetical protein (539) ;mRNA; r:283827-286169